MFAGPQLTGTIKEHRYEGGCFKPAAPMLFAAKRPVARAIRLT